MAPNHTRTSKNHLDHQEFIVKFKNVLTAVSLALISAASFPATPIYQLSYSVPASAGIVWVVIEPALVDYKNYQASITVTWGLYNKKIKLPQKEGGESYVIGFTHWDNVSSTMTVTSNNVSPIFSKTNKAIITQISQGKNPAGLKDMKLYCGYSSAITC